jgi:hypothetical protein
MSDELERLVSCTKTFLDLRGDPTAIGKKLVNELRAARRFDLMVQVAEFVSRRSPNDVENRRFYAQGLIETVK